MNKYLALQGNKDHLDYFHIFNINQLNLQEFLYFHLYTINYLYHRYT
jgi:hypothetical protein